MPVVTLLEPCTNLRTITIELLSGEPPEHTKIVKCASVLVSQLHSPFLDTITLRIDNNPYSVVWEGDDWNFDHLRMVDWRSINDTLERPALKDLRKFEIIGRGPKGALEACLDELCRNAYRRGLFRLTVRDQNSVDRPPQDIMVPPTLGRYD
ncbi:uncharacterized protein C8Q71DRAFT_293050 [Rhodofomes roseus]|uniref:Uncharacterized protein n=1 Tax=Rhodofomes roseus TaxID=34475 RepID=A0ABQ8K4N0_9APHY|nr:uncharacterized protein C8Q71DRAFT_293050 [Rhodofomes roseus]KAH9831581.1 hypothetical protein C8Q71DRAFT_293050 [Rhodofomes roseus]